MLYVNIALRSVGQGSARQEVHGAHLFGLGREAMWMICDWTVRGVAIQAWQWGVQTFKRSRRDVAGEPRIVVPWSRIRPSLCRAGRV